MFMYVCLVDGVRHAEKAGQNISFGMCVLLCACSRAWVLPVWHSFNCQGCMWETHSSTNYFFDVMRGAQGTCKLTMQKVQIDDEKIP